MIIRLNRNLLNELRLKSCCLNLREKLINCYCLSAQTYTSSAKPNEFIKFSESPAFKQYKSNNVGGVGRRVGGGGGGGEFDYLSTYTPKFQQRQAFVMIGCVIVTVVYFGFLREENDIDEELSRPLWKRVPSLERETLVTLIKEGEIKGKDVTEYKKRVDELDKQLANAKYK